MIIYDIKGKYDFNSLLNPKFFLRHRLIRRSLKINGLHLFLHVKYTGLLSSVVLHLKSPSKISLGNIATQVFRFCLIICLNRSLLFRIISFFLIIN